jgi:glutathione-regulated potassium-efflux system ancillary protein KefC
MNDITGSLAASMEPWQIDAIWLSLAFLAGIASKRINLPPLIGFLFTGFVLNATGLTSGNLSALVHALSDLGVMLLLFTIGLKIKVKTLIRPEIWVTATVHMVLNVVAFSGVLFLLAYLAASMVGGISLTTSLMIGFALSFSSTVFVVKVLEERGEINSQHGKIAIGILVIQDIFAVLYISFSSELTPGLGVLLLPLVLVIVRKLLFRLLDNTGHGELLTVFGFFAAFIAGAMSFALAGLKADLGALVIGMLMTAHPRASELYDRMMSFKDFFLIAFFVSIGLSGQITLNAIWIALIFIALLPIKSALYLIIFRQENVRARTAFLTALSMSNYSEFGLIVGVAAERAGLITPEWLVAIALMMSGSFLISAPLNRKAHAIYSRFKDQLKKLNRESLVINPVPVAFGNARFLVVGLGTIGLPAYQYLTKKYGHCVLGLEFNSDRVLAFQQEGYNVALADATDALLWESTDSSRIEVVLLAMSDFEANLNCIREMVRMKNRRFKIGVIVHYEDQRDMLERMGIEYVYCYKDRLGREFAKGFFEPAA